MAFQPTDLYLPSGTGTLINNWVDPVYKFDSSSFYNWEQDNLPIYDLEDRDDYLYEMAGYPTSAVDGIMLTVSACGIDNKKVFGTVSDALEALPNTIRFPIIIEVCTSGQLGGIHVENKEFEGSSAGLEIINRGFAKSLCGSSTAPSSLISIVDANSSAITQFSSTDLSNTMLESSSLGVSNTVWQKNPAGAWSWWGNFTRTFVLAPEWAQATTNSNKTITISTKFTDTTTDFLDTVANKFNVENYTDNSTSGETQITNPKTSALVQRSAYVTPTSTSRAVGLVYANSASGVTVKDCAGKVYIRGFCVDGGSQASLNSGGSQRTNIGFDIENSEVLIENCTATRCKDAGLQAVNSHVTLNRGFIAFRNYELETVGGAALDAKVTTNPTPGLRALTSTITLDAATEDALGLPLDSPFCFYKNMVGMELQNSVVQTPADFRYEKDTNGETQTNSNGSQSLVLQTFFNINEGIKAVTSTINTGQVIASFQNDKGIVLDNSVVKTAIITADHNRYEGVKAVNSVLNYNQYAELMWGNGPFFPNTNFDNNGQHIVLSNSEVIPTWIENMPSLYGRFGLSGTHGMNKLGSKYASLPSVVVTDGSHMRVLAPRCEVHQSTVDGNSYMADRAVKGSIFQVTKGSNLELNGFGINSTMILGPYSSDKQQKTAALYAGDNSHIKLSGPTSIVQFGVNALAESNSTVEISPPEKDNAIDDDGFNLGNKTNHTKVQLHATRACLVANKNSHIYMHDLGDYHKYWSAKHLVDAEDYETQTTGGGLGLSSFVEDGYVQFYPNPFAPYGLATDQLNLQGQAGWCADNNKVGLDGGVLKGYEELPQQDLALGNSVSSLSYGGMCVRAVGGSEVTARNVTFPTGWANPSGPYYDASTTGNCDLLRIWNIADNSELHASYLTTFSSYPEEASGTYYGPSAVWTSDTGPAGTGLSGAPSGTADTSGLSVLDSFGLGVATGGALGYYGKPQHQNIGPFRIYVSPHPKSKWLGYPYTIAGEGYMPPQPPAAFVSMGFSFPNTATLKTGAPYQLYAQGYSTSSDCSSLDPATASGIYQDLGMSGHIITLPSSMQIAGSGNPHYVASSFFYTSAMLSCDNETRIWLDESAMNTFANAKNGTLGTSGRKKIFSYYKAILDYPGEGWWQANAGFGKGFGSANLFDLDRDL